MLLTPGKKEKINLDNDMGMVEYEECLDSRIVNYFYKGFLMKSLCYIILK